MSLLPHNMYFLGILCPPEIEEKVLQYKNWMKEHFRCIVALKSPGHITLVPPFWFVGEKEPELLQTLQSFHTDNEKLEIRLNGFSHFTNRVLFIEVEENPALTELKKRVEEHFNTAFGEQVRRDDRHFHPHVTIANRDLSPGAYEEAWAYFEKKDFSKNFKTKEIALLKLNQGKWEVIGETIFTGP